jgi:cytochrome c1
VKPVFLAAAALCAFLALACAGKLLPQPNELQAAYATRAGTPSTLTSLQEGRQLYVAKCDGCHSLPYVQDYSPAEWVDYMNEMSVEAKLSATEDALVRTYVVTSALWLRDSLSFR